VTCLVCPRRKCSVMPSTFLWTCARLPQTTPSRTPISDLSLLKPMLDKDSAAYFLVKTSKDKWTFISWVPETTLQVSLLTCTGTPSNHFISSIFSFFFGFHLN
jgi:hypothetical protein